LYIAFINVELTQQDIALLSNIFIFMTRMTLTIVMYTSYLPLSSINLVQNLKDDKNAMVFRCKFRLLYSANNNLLAARIKVRSLMPEMHSSNLPEMSHGSWNVPPRLRSRSHTFHNWSFELTLSDKQRTSHRLFLKSSLDLRGCSSCLMSKRNRRRAEI